MKHEALKIVFFGRSDYAIIYKEALENAGHEVFIIKNFDKIEEIMEKIMPDLGIIACHGKIIPESILKIPKYGFLNVHPSLLPKWRGPSPVRSALLWGNKKTGVTIHITTPKVDAGDIIAQKEFAIEPNDDYVTLEEKLFKEGANMLLGAIKSRINGDIVPQKQDESRATYSKKARTEDGLINWSRAPEEILRQIKAYSPEPGVYAIINGKRLKIKKAESIENQQNVPPGTFFKAGVWLVVKCGKDALKLLIVQPECKKDMPGDAYLRGHKEILVAE